MGITADQAQVELHNWDKMHPQAEDADRHEAMREIASRIKHAPYGKEAGK